jgi:antirestriction protein ArdC
MPSQAQIRDEVTARIIEALEADLLPWRRPWRATVGGSQPGRHSNVASRKPYQGVNQILLELHAMRLGLLSRWWGTFPMWKSIGCNILKRPSNVEEGRWGARVVFYKPFTKTVVDDRTADEDEERFFVLKTFTVFNADQVDGAEAFQVHQDESQPHAEPDFQPAEELMLASEADIRDGGDRAYYRRPTPVNSFPNHQEGDFIVLPNRATFNPPGSFYETAIHELSHWAECRTGWDHDKQGYALGKLAAEIASCYVAAELGIPQGEGLGNHAAYLKSWLEALKNDRNYIFKAAKQASKGTDYLLSFVKSVFEKGCVVIGDSFELPALMRSKHCSPNDLGRIAIHSRS